MTKSFLPEPAVGKTIRILIVGLTCLSLAACTGTLNRPHFAAPPQEAQVIAAQENQVRDLEVTVTAPVKRILPDDTKGLPHQRFLIGLANGTTVLIAHNTEQAPHVPISETDTVTIHGVYIYNEKGGVIHWTHHSDGRHEGGYIEFQGKRYE